MMGNPRLSVGEDAREYSERLPPFHRFAVRVPPPLGAGRNHSLPIPILYANVVESAL